MVDDFSYINARIRGMRTELLGPEDFRALLDAPDLSRTFSYLRGTVYGVPLQSALSHKAGVPGAEEGLRSAFLLAFNKLVCISSGNSGAMVRSALGRWERQCLKTILRGKLWRASPETILEAALPAGAIDETALQRLASLDTVEEVLDTLRLWGYPLAARLRRQLKIAEGGPGHLEQHLERENVRIIRESLADAGPEGEALRELTRLEVDCANVLTALRLLRSSRDASSASSFFLEGGGEVKRGLFENMVAAADTDAAVESVKDLRVGEPFGSALAEHRRTGRLSPFEKEVYRFLTRQGQKWSARDALGIGVALGYIWEKSQEVGDLRLLCRAKEAGMPRETLAAELLNRVS